MAKQDIIAAIDSYRAFLDKAQAQHERTIAEANAQLQALIESASRSAVPKAAEPPQSVWIKGNDGEPMLLLNEPAAALIGDLIERLKDVVGELAKLQAAKGPADRR